MKYKTRVLSFALLLAVLTFGCDSINIFDSGGKNEKATGTPADSTILFVEISGSIAGVNQLFYIHESGVAIFQDAYYQGTRYTKQFSPAQLDSLRQVMQENNYFQLSSDSSYVDSQVADAFYYNILYTRNNQSHRVSTDGFGAPANLQRIVEYIVKLVNKTRNNGLELGLRLSDSQIQKGNSVEMTLAVRNAGSLPITLKFADGRIFDFKTVNALSAAPVEVVVWNWAHDQVFTQQVWQLVLNPGETKSYSVTWDGTGNSGDQVVGHFLVSASLVSVPGGTTHVQNFQITE